MENTNQNQPYNKRQDIKELVTDTIIKQLESGTVPWQKPWDGEDHIPLSLPQNAITNNFYRGINIVLLWCSAIKNEYQSDQWASLKQWNDKKESVRKGEKGNLIVYYDTFEKEVDGEKQKIPFLKSSYVFNRCQLKSYDADEKKITKPDIKNLIKKIDEVENFVNQTGVKIEHDNKGARYIPSKDKIILPKYEMFKPTKTCTATEGYYSTLMHELTHWTGNKERLNREGGKKYGDNKYATEELVAEFGAAFLCAGFGIATLEKGDHAGYIEHWLKVLKEDKTILFTAASDASKAVEYLNGLQPN